MFAPARCSVCLGLFLGPGLTTRGLFEGGCFPITVFTLVNRDLNREVQEVLLSCFNKVEVLTGRLDLGVVGSLALAVPKGDTPKKSKQGYYKTFHTMHAYKYDTISLQNLANMTEFETWQHMKLKVV